MATRTKTTAVAEPDVANEVSVDLADAVGAPVKTVPAKATPAKKAAPAKKAVPKVVAVADKAPAQKASIKRGTKAATPDDEEDSPEDEADTEVEILVVAADSKDNDAKDESSEDSDEDKDDKTAEILPSGALVLSLVDDEDEVPVYSSAITGATADPVKDYLKQIGKVALLNAAEEVELAMRIEAGLFAEDKLADMTPAELKSQLGRELTWVAKDGQRAKSHLLGANLRLVVSLAKRYTGRGMQFLDLIQEGNLGLIRAV